MGVGNVYDETVDGLKTISLPNSAEDTSDAESQSGAQRYHRTYSVLGTFRPSEKTIKRHLACCESQKRCLHKD